MEKLKTLAELRAEKNISQRELAERLHTSSGSIGMYECGKRTPPLNKAIEIAKFFGIPVEQISFSSVENEQHLEKHSKGAVI